jgi:hypothetical protein
MEHTTTPEAKMTRQTPITSGTWNRIARKHYQHISGIQVIYRHNAWAWEVVGGKDDGHRYGTLSVAQHAATLG